MHAITMNKEEGINFKENKEGYIRNFRWRKGKGEMLCLYYNLKKKGKNYKKKKIIQFCVQVI